MLRLVLFYILIFVATIGFARAGFADEIQKDANGVPGSHSLQPSNRKVQVKQWFDAMGIDTNSDGFAHDMYHLMSGIDEKISPTSNFSVSAGNGVHMGVTF